MLPGWPASPGSVLSGIWLLQGRPSGFGLAAVVLTNFVCQGLGIASIGAFSIRAGLPGGPAPIAAFGLLSAVQAVLLGWYLARMKPNAGPGR